jgi:phenylalanyl-tRNA synthetase beta chain
MDSSLCAKVILNGQDIGTIGRVDSKVLSQWDIKTKDIYFAGIHLESLYALEKKTVKYNPVTEFPAIVRDVSLAVKKDISYVAIEKICREHSSDILRHIQFIEQYVGDKIPSDQKALVFSLVYQSNTRTLREEEVNTAQERIVSALIQQLKANRR